MGIIRHVVSASSALSWFIKYIYVWNLEFLKNVIYWFIKTKDNIPKVEYHLLVYLLPLTFKSFGYPILWLWAYLTLFVLLNFFFLPLCCLFFFDIRILITSLWYLQTLLFWWRLFHKYVVVPEIKYLPFLLSTNMNHIITRLLTCVTRRATLVVRGLLTIAAHMSSLAVFVGFMMLNL